MFYLLRKMEFKIYFEQLYTFSRVDRDPRNRVVAVAYLALVPWEKLSKEEQELTAIAGFCHDIGNFVGRTQHHYWGAILFQQVFCGENPKNTSLIMQAIANHDKGLEMKLASPISAIVVLADKSDVHRSRVLEGKIDKIKEDIHDRVNYATTFSKLKIDKQRKKIALTLKIDTNFTSIMEYFEIFTDRMAYCRDSAKYLGYNFGLVINKFKLL